MACSKDLPESSPPPAETSSAPTIANEPASELPTLLLPGSVARFRPEPPLLDSEHRVLAFDQQRALRSEGMQWAWSVRNRRRWAEDPARVKSMGEEARGFVQSMLDTATLQQLAMAELVQVSVPFSTAAGSIESHVMPWEFLLTAATRELRAGRPLVVCRQLAVKGRAPPPPRKPLSVLYVESQPGRIFDMYSFAGEQALVKAALCSDEGALAWHELRQPSPATLKAEILRLQPDIIHLAGFDSHQGCKLLEQAGEQNLPQGSQDDGYLLLSDDGFSVQNLKSADLAAIIAAAPRRPLLLSLSLWNSASRLAPALIAAGVQAVLSFQDSYRDELVEELFADFYRKYRVSGWLLCDAFRGTVLKLQREASGTIGSGVVLWTAMPLVDTQPSQSDAFPPADYNRRTWFNFTEHAAATLIKPAKLRQEDIDSHIRVEVKPFEEFNYARLHNKKPLFQQFKLMRMTQHRFSGINITVDLHVGEATIPWRRTVTLDMDKLDLSRDIQIAQTAAVLRSAREAINSLLFVEVTWGERTLLRESYSVSLPPADLWRDVDPDRWWLPSFILPRDTCIGGLIATAQNYVRVLRDDPYAGFDGYQAMDSLRDDPSEDVDLQVQAIWSALVHEWRLSYINPPPAYGGKSLVQRLRSPSLIHRYRCGTCIDLALLLAACLELVDIYPVLFLTKGHAFVGYWRNPEAHERFRDARTQASADMDESRFERDAPVAVQAEPWVSGLPAYYEIVRNVEDRDLIVIETTALTDGSGFWAAAEAGQRNLDNEEAFELMIDVATARAHGVCPLPVIGEPL